MRLYNTLTRKKEFFVPIKKGQVLMYTCGPTVHDYAHIGNFRTFVVQDVLRRWLRHKGYRVKQVMNITDVDEKTIERARRKKMELNKMAHEYSRAFFEDLKALNIESADVYPCAGNHVDDMAKVAERLLKNGSAFKSKDGTVYFDINRSKEYGRLSKKMPKKKVIAKTKREDYTEPKHFALWKPQDRGDEMIYWDTVLGKGQPGWHVECCTMAMKYLGNSIDIHSGGSDLIFPHHENSRAISEALTGREFSKFWIHCEHLIVEGEKMSKTLRNYFTLKDIIQQGYSPSAVRLVLLFTHYRKKLDFTFKKLDRAERDIFHLRSFVRRLKRAKSTDSIGTLDKDLLKVKRTFDEGMDDDLDLESGLKALFGFTHKYLSKEINEEDSKKVYETLIEIDEVLGLLEESQ
ncbi:MAG: cysteine--tRNA ligase [Candidatus Hydrothermarchaeaceae archaeon]